MEELSGFAAFMAKYRVRQEWHKPLLGKPFMRYGQCIFLASYSFQLGGVLGCRYRDRLEDFAWAFLGLRGEEAGAVRRFYGEVAEGMLRRVSECSTILDYVSRTHSETMHFTGDCSELFLRYGMNKLKPDLAAQMCWNFAQEGSAFGAVHPGDFRRLFDESNKKRDEKSWQLAHASGLDIPEEQDVLTYDEVEQEEVESFLCYCQECAPNLYASLSGA